MYKNLKKKQCKKKSYGDQVFVKCRLQLKCQLLLTTYHRCLAPPLLLLYLPP